MGYGTVSVTVSVTVVETATETATETVASFPATHSKVGTGAQLMRVVCGSAA